MNLIVQKFGGSSISDIDKIKKVAKIIVRRKRKGDKVVVVVSALGDTTDNLLSLAKKISKSPSEREIDMLLTTGEQQSIALLSMAIHSLGEDAISLTGAQVGIITDKTHTKARIKEISTEKIKLYLKKHKIVIVAGFQGISSEFDITTLGRGGSDLTAIALAAVLKAKRCEIYTDVKGVYTSNPLIVPDARKLDRISYDEMLELADMGAEVMQARSIQLAKRFNVELHIRCAFSNDKGTLITQEASMIEEYVISGVTYDKDQVKMSVIDVPDKPGIAAQLFTALAKEHINIDMIIQSTARRKRNDISFTIASSDLKKALVALDKVKKRIKAGGCIYDPNVAKVSLVGVGMRTHSGVASRMFSVLAKNKINIEMIATSEIKISCVIRKNDAEKAIKAIHKEFNLGKTGKPVK